MKFKLTAGSELDLLTKDELDEVFKRHADALEQRLEGRPRRVRGAGDWQPADANGDATLYPYRVPIGCTFILHTVIATEEDATASAPVKNAGIAIEVHRDSEVGDLVDFAPEPDQAGQLPTAIKRIDYPFSNGEAIVVLVSKATAGKRVYANVLGELVRGEVIARKR